MSKSIKSAMLCFGLCFFMSHVLQLIGDTALQSIIYSVIPSILTSVSVTVMEES